jgi:hypothetical protein
LSLKCKGCNEIKNQNWVTLMLAWPSKTCVTLFVSVYFHSTLSSLPHLSFLPPLRLLALVYPFFSHICLSFVSISYSSLSLSLWFPFFNYFWSFFPNLSIFTKSCSMSWLFYLVELVGIRQSCEDTVESSEPLVNEDWPFRFWQRQQRRFVQRHRLHLEEVKI